MLKRPDICGSIQKAQVRGEKKPNIDFNPGVKNFLN